MATATATPAIGNANWEQATSVYDFTAKSIHGDEVPLSKYKGLVLVIVNVASACGFAGGHYTELAQLDSKYKNKGLRILTFSCNQFNNQESGTNEEICEFVKKFNADFEMFDKIDVNGKNAHPLYNYLKSKQGGFITDGIKWNFTKFIVDRHGIPVHRAAADVKPLNDKFVSVIEKCLAEEA